MIHDVNEEYYRGWFWKVKALFSVLALFFRYRQSVWIGVNVAGKGYDLSVKYVGLEKGQINDIVSEWTDYDRAASKIEVNANSILGEAANGKSI
ncbi:MAG: hypothetical protein V1799_07545 [bacterium]